MTASHTLESCSCFVVDLWDPKTDAAAQAYGLLSFQVGDQSSSSFRMDLSADQEGF